MVVEFTASVLSWSVVLLILLAAPLSSRAAPSAQGMVTLEINHLWNGEAVAIPSGELARAGGDSLTLTRLAYLLSEPRIKSAHPDSPQTEWLQRGDWFAFVDGADDASRVTLAGLPRGRFAALQFHIGLDEETNTSDPNQYPPDHPLNPVRNNLHWSWQGEYIFMALEGRSRSQQSGADLQSAGSERQVENLPHVEADLQSAARAEWTGFSYHLGNAPLLMTVTLPVDLDLASGDAVVSLDFHLDRVFDGGDPIDIAAQTSTHGRDGDALAVTLKKRIENAFTVREVRSLDAPEVASASPKETTDSNLVGTPYAFKLRKGFPLPSLPIDYPMTEERVALGEKLFHDTLLSKANTISCASCHETANAFTDARRFSLGDEGQEGRRNSMPLFNLAWKTSFFWDGRAPSLREQALVPIEDPVEMHESLEHVEEKLAASEDFPALFEAAFGDKEITAEKLGIAIEQFVLTLTSFDSKFDRAHKGKDTLTEQEQRGFELFFTEYDPGRGQLGADCFHCHGGSFFTDHRFHNNGLAATDDRGLEEVTGLASDRGKFSTPSLRNVALTAPYMHDGRFDTLEAVLDHYTSGVQRSDTLDPNLAKHPRGGVPLTEDDKAAVIAFLKTLTDEKFAHVGPGAPPNEPREAFASRAPLSSSPDRGPAAPHAGNW